MKQEWRGKIQSPFIGFILQEKLITEYYDPAFLFLKQEDVIAAGALDMKAAEDDVELTYKLFASGQVNQPHKPVMHFSNPKTGQEEYYLTVSMPVYVGGEVNRVGHKWAAESMDNAKRGDMPMGIDIVLLHDLEHAIPHAIMEGGLITAMRTSAVAGVGARISGKSRFQSCRAGWCRCNRAHDDHGH